MSKSYSKKRLSLLLLLAGFFLGFTGVATAQYTVEGTVTDASNGEVLAGVNIFDVNSQGGTATDAEGNFSITIPDNDPTTLRISFIGFVTQNIEVNPSTDDLNVELQPDVANLEEVVVTGLASSVKRSNLANSVTKLDADELAGDVTPQTLDGAFKGKIPGVNITSQSGAPGGGINVQMRGISTLGAGNSQPLYIIDGVYVNNDAITNARHLATGANDFDEDNAANRLADLNPSEIESIEVLKGPSAAAIYGARANSGVVIITTKRGSAGKTQVSVKQDIGFNSALNLIGVAEWTAEKIDIFDAVIGLPTGATQEKQLLAQAQANGNIHNYEDVLYGNEGLVNQTSISVSGGDEKTRFYVNGSTKNEDSIIRNTGFERNSFRVNIDHNITPKIRVSSRSNYIKTDTDRGFTGNQNGTGGSVGYALSAIPTYAQLFPDADGEFPDNPYFADNPLSIAANGVNNQEVQRIIQGVNFDADLFTVGASTFSLAIDGGLDYLTFNSKVLFPSFLQHQQNSANPGDVLRTEEANFNTNLQAILSFQSEAQVGFGSLSLNTQIGGSRINQDQDRTIIRGQGLASGQDNVEQSRIQSIINQAVQEVVDVSWFGQQEVNFEDKIIATVGARLDRSSLNADQDEYYFFPKASLALNLANFDFWKWDLFNQFKVRSAYGETGGLPNFGNTFNSLDPGNIGGRFASFAAVRSVDPNLQPETAQEIEVGLDFALLEGRVSFEGTYYNKKVDDLILDRQVPVSSGIQVIATNAAELKNTGFELALNVSPIRSRQVNWTSTILFWTNESEITDLTIDPFVTGGFGPSLGGFLIQEGFSPTTIVGNPAVSGPSLFTVYGDGQPDFEMSFGNEFTIFRNFDVNFLFHWKKGGQNINLTQLLTDAGGTSPDWNVNIENTDLGTFTEETLPLGLSRLIFGGTGAYIQDTDYLKLREAAIYYNVPVSTLRQWFGNTVRKVRVGVSGNNLLMWTPYDSYDPETSVFGTQPINSGVEVTPFPSTRQIMFHLSLDF